MKIYKTTRYPWAYLVYGATKDELAKLDATRLFTTPSRRRRKTPQRTAECRAAAEAALKAAGAQDIPPAEPPISWAMAEEENRYSDNWEATYGR